MNIASGGPYLQQIQNALHLCPLFLKSAIFMSWDNNFRLSSTTVTSFMILFIKAVNMKLAIATTGCAINI